MSRHLFFVDDPSRPPPTVALPEGYSLRIWRADRDGRPQPPLSPWPNLLWWLFDRLGLFARPGAGVLMIMNGDRLAHRSLVTPRWHRFPDMDEGDLQIGDTWTHPDDRGRGLAKAAIGAIHQAWTSEFRRMWYLVGDDNPASVSVIEACHYRLAGRGVRTRPLGLSLLGQFRIDRSERRQIPGE